MPFDEGRYRERDDPLEKLDKVIALLATEDRWCKFFGLSGDGRRCLWGALWAEDAAAILEAPVLRAVRQVTGFPFESVDAFNDHPATTHATVLTVLHRVRHGSVDNVASDFAIPLVARTFRLARPPRGRSDVASAGQVAACCGLGVPSLRAWNMRELPGGRPSLKKLVAESAEAAVGGCPEAETTLPPTHPTFAMA